MAYIDIRDVSEAAALVLRDPTMHGRTHEWSGPDAYTFPEAAALLSKILGREIRYVPVAADERRSALLGAGLAKWYTELFISLDTAAEAGALQAVTTTLKELLGREPRTVEEFLTETATQSTK